MDMIGHQTVSVNVAMGSRRRLAQLMQVDEIVGVYAKARLPIVSPLYDVESDACYSEPWRSGHPRTTVDWARG
jgi:hypothetical protein